MRRLVLLVILMMLPAVPIRAQNAPDAINRALDDLSGRLDENIRLSDLENWTYERQIFPDASMGCPQPGVSYAQVMTDGYRFSLTYHGITADYRVSADQRFAILCNTEAIVELARPTCPPPDDPAYLPARLEIGVQGRVTAGGLPNNIRSQPGTSGTFLGEIPPGEVFTVLDGPECSLLDKLVWWQVDYNGLIGWTASGQDGDYWIEPLGGQVAPDVVAITAANAAQVASVPMARNIQMVAALSPDGSKFATAVQNGVAVDFILDPNGARLMIGGDAIPTTESASTLAFDSTGNRLIAGYPDGTMVLISTAPGDAITAIWTIGSSAAVNVVNFSPDGALLVSGGADGNVSLWDSRTGASLVALRGHVAPVVRVEFSADGSTILSQDDSGIVILWQVGAGGDINFG